MDIKVPITTEDVTCYSALGTGVLVSQQIIQRTLSDRRSGVKYWLKLTGATLVGLIGGTFLGNVIQEYRDGRSQQQTVTSDSSAKTSTVTKQSDTSSL